MRHWQDELEQAVLRWRTLGRPAPDVALVAGSGLSVDLGTPVAGPEPLADWLPFPGASGRPVTGTRSSSSSSPPAAASSTSAGASTAIRATRRATLSSQSASRRSSEPRPS